ncbi:MAG: response regulator [Actinobacteria bacterium]|nr:MAG: response regulator [Actinomycetota bacterium]
MPAWFLWILYVTLAWSGIVGFLLLSFRRFNRQTGFDPKWSPGEQVAAPVGGGGTVEEPTADELSGAAAAEESDLSHRLSGRPLCILVVDDDPNLRALLRTSFEVADIEVDEADSAKSAAAKIASRHPDVIVLDVSMPGMDGITFCRGLKADPFTRAIPVVLLTGDPSSEKVGREAGADAFLRKPFSPLELLTLSERLGQAPAEQAPHAKPDSAPDKQLLLYAQDFRRLLELERGQRMLLQDAYRETVVALARALESKDGGTGAHSERVRRYATELTEAFDPTLLDEPGLEYGFILHDVGKIGIPDHVLAKPGPLTEAERRLIESHTVLGEQMVGEAALLRGQGARVVRSHHERWDGEGYPDHLAADEIPLGARIFTIADALDAMTSERPYRRAGSWEDAVSEIEARAGTQFDPTLVDVFHDREEALRRIYFELNRN